MSTTLYKRTSKYRQQSRIFKGKYSFDYVTLSLENDKEMNPKLTTKENDSGVKKDKNAWRRDFMEKLELSVLNKHIHERLNVTTKAQLNWLAPCFRTPYEAKNSAVRRRCFCECIGPKFCEICRKKVEKELSSRVPRIICDLKNSENELSLLERAEYFVTPEPKFSKHLKQASILYKHEGYHSLQVDDQTTLRVDDQGSSIKTPQYHAISRASSYSSLTSSKHDEVVNGVIVPLSPQNTPTTPVVLGLPSINDPRRSPDIPNDESVPTSFPQLPAITNDPLKIFDQQNSCVSPNDEYMLSDIHQPPLIPNDIPNDPQNLSTFDDSSQSPETVNELDISNGSQMFHITHQLRSINELKADASFHNSPSNQNIPPIAPEHLSSSSGDTQRKIVSSVNNEDDSSKSTQSVLDESAVSLKIDVKQTDNHILPNLPHPVEPVLLELKYINFSIYDYDCNMDK